MSGTEKGLPYKKRECPSVVGDADLSGQSFGGYRMIRQLGKGGMGAVYEAESPDGARVALKVFASTGAHADFLRKRFAAEGKILSRLSSEHLVTVRKTGCDPESGTPYFTMDLVLDAAGEPCTLENLRRRGGLDEAAIVAIYADLRAALVFLHEKGVVHRDIKLENVLVDANGRAVLSDFGVSRILRKDLRDEIALTTTFAADRAPIMGSAGYLSPELMEGKAATPADDAWALGVLVFRLLTGVWYEEDSSAMELTAGFELDWEAVFSVLLNADPARRLPLPPAPFPEAAANKARSRRTFVWAAVGAAVVAVAVFVSVRLSAPAYDFDEFFPPLQEAVVQ